MQIGVIGSGDVAKVLAAGFLKHGHTVTVGSRTPEKLAGWASKHRGAQIGTFARAAEFGELLVVAVKGNVAADALRLAGAQNLSGKTVIDVCNPIANDAPVNGVLRLYTDYDDSLLEQLQHEFPSAHFVKAFNSVGNARMVNPQFEGGKPTMFICGDDDAAKKTVTLICDEFGWETEDMGTAVAARAIEPLCILWCIPGFLRNEWTHAFKLLKK
jgi:predicted dinucleotide-binding enzyme